jgi:hypothetical protein
MKSRAIFFTQGKFYKCIPTSDAAGGDEVTEGYCIYCANPMFIDEFGVSHHIDQRDGGIDYDQDADHVAVLDKDFGWEF